MMMSTTIYWKILFLLFLGELAAEFAPDTTSYDAYGIKLAANDVMLVEARSDSKTFLIQFAPYNHTGSSLQCAISYDDPTHYVYSVGIGAQQNVNKAPYFFVLGEVLPPSDSLGNNGTFIALWINNDSTRATQYASAGQPIACNYFKIEQLNFLSTFTHQEFMALSVDPYGQFALVFATDFVFIYQPFANNSNGITTVKKSTSVWPNNVIFLPRAADTDVNFTIVAGFVDQGPNSQIRSKPVVYLLSNNLTVLDSWSYAATNSTWQARLTNAGSTGVWTAMYVMSVDINPFDHSRVLVGLPSTNTLLYFTVGNHGTTLTLTSFIDNGGNLGYGKGVAWLALNQAAVLNCAYSLDYSTWLLSQVYLYTNANAATLGDAIDAVVPNTQQPLGTTISPFMINVVSTPSALAILDGSGGILFLLSAAPGYYASTDTSSLRGTAAMPLISQQVPCIGGTFKSDYGVYPCFPCNNGSRNPGTSPAIVCQSCSSSAFCPLGAVAETNLTELALVSQALAYPKSPESTIFDEILIQNMFSIGTTFHCVVVSPLFWMFIMMGLGSLVLIFMAALRFWIIHPRKHLWQERIKATFRQVDLVGEGELWMGGLVSFAIIVLVSFAFAFSSNYLKQYPLETVGPSNFACDTTIRNAKFDSSLLSLSIPPSDEEQDIFDLLDSQQFTLTVDLLNTLAACTSVSVSQVIGGGTSTSALASIGCTTSNNGTLSISVALPYQGMTVQLIIADIQLIGAVRIGLLGDGAEDEHHTLRKLDFRQTFSVDDSTLAQTGNIGLQLTKAINETETISGTDESQFAGIWYPTFTVDKNQMFLTKEKYMTTTNLAKTTLTIAISETPFYIQNHQAPITKRPEVIFHNLLFTIVCIEIFGLIFLLFKLLVIPVFELIKDRHGQNQNNRVKPMHGHHGDHEMIEHRGGHKTEHGH